MAQFTVGGRVKPSFRGDGLSIGFEAFHLHINSRSGGLRRLTKHWASKESDIKRKPCFFAGFKVHSSSARDGNSNGGGYVDIMEEDEDYVIDELSGFRGLVLDISYRPVNVVCWKRAICLEFMDKADVLEYYDQTVNSPSGSFYIPAVLRVPHLLQVIKRRKVKRGLSRKSIYNRDNFTCQYCSATENLTVDHVCPLSRGGKWTWENLVCACAKCNSKKGQKTLEEANMKLLKVPKAPKDYDILSIPLTNQTIKMLRAKTGMPEEWRQYLSKPYAAP